jgi:hypothetical protein
MTQRVSTRIVVKPGKRLSPPRHQHRAEPLVVVRGTARHFSTTTSIVPNLTVTQIGRALSSTTGWR